MEAYIMRLTNRLLSLLEFQASEELIDRVVAAVSANVPFDESEIALKDNGGWLRGDSDE